MKRAILISMGTIAGTTAVLAYQPGAILGATARADAVKTTASLTPAALASASSAATSTGAHTYTGDSVQTQFGPVQVQVTVENGSITDVTTLAYPSNDGHSAQINAQAVPALQNQALSAQSANLDGVSGASYTSAAFEQSLQSALVQAGLS
jgi:uncharacterized protein with FMN-binding domain